MNIKYLDLVNQACPICQGNDFSLLKENDRYFMDLKTVGCNHCGLIQMNPRPSDAGLSQFYEKDYRQYYQGIDNPSEEYIKALRKEKRMEYLVSFLKNHLHFDPSQSILDIGCSEGALFSELRSRSFEGALYGIELNPVFADYAQINNDAKVFSSLDEVKITFDLIILNHVFEHLLNPKIELSRIKQFLKKDGVLYIEVPDAEEYTSIVDLHIAHIYHYTTNTLSYLLESSGFEILHVEKHSPPNHPKSIRVVVKRNEGQQIINRITNANRESTTWSNIKNLPTLYYSFKNSLKKIPFVYITYTKVKECIQRYYSKRNIKV